MFVEIGSSSFNVKGESIRYWKAHYFVSTVSGPWSPLLLLQLPTSNWLFGQVRVGVQGMRPSLLSNPAVQLINPECDSLELERTIFCVQALFLTFNKMVSKFFINSKILVNFGMRSLDLKSHQMGSIFSNLELLYRER